MEKNNFLKIVSPHILRIAEEIYDYKYGGEEKKRKSWYATDIGKCLRGVVYDRLVQDGKITFEKKKKPQYVENVGHEGKMKELELIVQMILDGETILDTQERLYNEELDMSGRPDVVIRREGNPVLPEPYILSVEIKSVNSRSFWYRVDKEHNVFLPYPHHVLQTTFYLHELQKKHKESVQGELWYRSRDDGTTFKVPVRYDEKNWGEIIKQAILLEKGYTGTIDDTPAVDIVMLDEVKDKLVINWQAQYCDYHELCAGKNWIEFANQQVKTSFRPKPPQFQWRLRNDEIPPLPRWVNPDEAQTI